MYNTINVQKRKDLPFQEMRESVTLAVKNQINN